MTSANLTRLGKRNLPHLTAHIRKKKFKYLLRRAFPNACLSDGDIYEALYFVRFIMKVQPEKRPKALKIKMHSFLKTASKSLLKELNEELSKETLYQSI